MEKINIRGWLDRELDGIEKNLTLEKLQELQKEAKRNIDKKVERFLAEHELVKKVKVPRVPWRYLLSTPFIYGMVFPAVFWHLCLEIYHQVCFRLYGIPRVDFRSYFVYDRQLLSLLNAFEKINCIYCSYVNNLIRYSMEIGGRTERYWCPIKYYRRITNSHSQYPKFADKEDLKHFRKQWEELRDFSDLKRKSS